MLAACDSPTAQQSTATTPPAAAPIAPADTTRPVRPALASPSAYAYTLPPVNQTAQHPALQAFVRRVQAACAAHRQTALLALVSDSVVVSYGGGIAGKAGFVSEFLNGDWGSYEKLQEAIRLGGTVQRDAAGRLTATYPYLQDGRLYEQNKPLAKLELDPFISYVGLEADVPIYRKPLATSPVLAHLRYPVLLTSYEAPNLPGDWLPVVAADSSFRGYAHASQFYCLANMTLTIESHGNSFWITSVAPYDYCGRLTARSKQKIKIYPLDYAKI